MAVGMAWKLRYRKEKGAVLCFFGDGAMNQGVVHEGLNLAALYKLPAIFVCENNGYAMGTAVSRSSAEGEIYKRASAYRMPTFRVNGNDLWEVRALTAERVAAARENCEPSFIEAVTYRFRGHSMSDPQKYRSKEEVEAAKARDPIGRVGLFLVKNAWATVATIEAVEKEIREEVEDAVRFAQESPEPEWKDALRAGGLVS